MKNLFRNVRIGEKIGIRFGLVGRLFLGVIWQYHTTLTRSISDYIELQDVYEVRKNHAFRIGHHMLEARRNENSFLSIVDAWKKKGLDHSSGLQGRFRTTAHELEALAENFKVDRLYLLLLQLRRREKDYQVDLTLKKRRRFQCV